MQTAYVQAHYRAIPTGFSVQQARPIPQYQQFAPRTQNAHLVEYYAPPPTTMRYDAMNRNYQTQSSVPGASVQLAPQPITRQQQFDNYLAQLENQANTVSHNTRVNQPSAYHIPPGNGGGHPIPGQPGTPGQPGGAIPIGNPNTPIGQPVNQPKSYMQHLGDGFAEMGHGGGTILEGYGQTMLGAGKTIVNAPLSGLEVLGRGAIAITGGRVVYDNPSPISRMGEGVADMAHGTYKMADGTVDVLAATGKVAVYAPAAIIEGTARGTGMVVGGVVAGGYIATRAAANSYVGQEFMKGFHSIIPKGGVPKDK